MRPDEMYVEALFEEAVTRTAGSQKGVTLIELMVAMLLLAIVTSMLYSVLNVGIKFSRKGEDRLAVLEVERSFLEVLHRQVHGAWYNKAERKVMIRAENDLLKITTTSPLQENYAGLVLAVYLYDSGERAIYYTEKLDFYNIDYGDNYFPSEDEMIVLLREVEEPDWQFDESEGVLTVSFMGKSYEMTPRTWPSEDLSP